MFKNEKKNIVCKKFYSPEDQRLIITARYNIAKNIFFSKRIISNVSFTVEVLERTSIIRSRDPWCECHEFGRVASHVASQKFAKIMFTGNRPEMMHRERRDPPLRNFGKGYWK